MLRKKLLLIALLIVGCEQLLESEDCAGVTGGTAVEDDCEGVCGGDKELDECDVCDGDGKQITYIEECEYNSICNG